MGERLVSRTLSNILSWGGASQWLAQKYEDNEYNNKPDLLAKDLIRDGFSPRAEIVTAAREGRIEEYRNIIDWS